MDYADCMLVSKGVRDQNQSQILFQRQVCKWNTAKTNSKKLEQMQNIQFSLLYYLRMIQFVLIGITPILLSYQRLNLIVISSFNFSSLQFYMAFQLVKRPFTQLGMQNSLNKIALTLRVFASLWCIKMSKCGLSIQLVSSNGILINRYIVLIFQIIDQIDWLYVNNQAINITLEGKLIGLMPCINISQIINIAGID